MQDALRWEGKRHSLNYSVANVPHMVHLSDCHHSQIFHPNCTGWHILLWNRLLPTDHQWSCSFWRAFSLWEGQGCGGGAIALIHYKMFTNAGHFMCCVLFHNYLTFIFVLSHLLAIAIPAFKSSFSSVLLSWLFICRGGQLGILVTMAALHGQTCRI